MYFFIDNWKHLWQLTKVISTIFYKAVTVLQVWDARRDGYKVIIFLKLNLIVQRSYEVDDIADASFVWT